LDTYKGQAKVKSWLKTAYAEKMCRPPEGGKYHRATDLIKLQFQCGVSSFFSADENLPTQR
jgi:hypothetical protein